MTLSLEIVGEGLVLLTGLDWCLFLLGHSLVELCTWVTSGWWNTCVCFHGLIIKKKKLSFCSQQPLSTLTELGSCTLYNIFCPFQGIIENNFCLSSGLIFCLEISRRVVTLLCLFVQVYETCTSVRSCLLVLSGFTMFRYKALFATQCLNLLLHSWVQYLFCLGI